MILRQMKTETQHTKTTRRGRSNAKRVLCSYKNLHLKGKLSGKPVNSVG